MTFASSPDTPDSIERFELTSSGISRTTMKAPSPGAGEVLIQVAGCALGVEPDGEVAGVVVAAGPNATDWMGKRVVVPRLLSCGECDLCRRARPAACARRQKRQGLATHEVVATRFLCSVEPPLWPERLTRHQDVKHPDDQLWLLAALADAASAPYGALVRAGLGPSELLVVIGHTVRGAFAQMLARSRGAHVVALEESVAPDVAHTLISRSCTDKGAIVTGTKILEATGTSAGRALALGICRGGETVVFLDGVADADALADRHNQSGVAPDWNRLAHGEITLLGATACHPDLLPELTALVVRGDVTFETSAGVSLFRSASIEEVPIPSRPDLMTILRPGLHRGR